MSAGGGFSQGISRSYIATYLGQQWWRFFCWFRSQLIPAAWVGQVSKPRTFSFATRMAGIQYLCYGDEVQAL